MRIAGDQPSIYDRGFDKYCNIAIGAWLKSEATLAEIVRARRGERMD